MGESASTFQEMNDTLGWERTNEFGTRRRGKNDSKIVCGKILQVVKKKRKIIHFRPAASTRTTFDSQRFATKTSFPSWRLYNT